MPTQVKISIEPGIRELFLNSTNRYTMLNIQILFTNYDIIPDFLNLAFCSEYFISIKHRILATFNKKSILTACKPYNSKHNFFQN
jgi:hypothetical protein